jgi:hypothetical protein
MKILLKFLISLLLVLVFTGAFPSFFSSINTPFISGIKPQRTGHLSIQKGVRRFLPTLFPGFCLFSTRSIYDDKHYEPDINYNE